MPMCLSIWGTQISRDISITFVMVAGIASDWPIQIMAMNRTQIQRTLVWSGRIPLAHWPIALSVIALLATGWLVKLAPSVANSASEAQNWPVSA